VGFLLAAPAAAPARPFFVAIGIASVRTRVVPDSLTWLAVPAAANIGALGGFSLTGVLNSGNGALGGLPAPLLAWWLWIRGTSGFTKIQQRQDLCRF
jgi:hypothetical protein